MIIEQFKGSTMNKVGRKRLSEAVEYLKYAQGIIEEVLEMEQESLSNIPESFQDTERVQRMVKISDILEESLSSVEEDIDNLESALE